jgi:hypothetical protein
MKYLDAHDRSWQTCSEHGELRNLYKGLVGEVKIKISVEIFKHRWKDNSTNGRFYAYKFMCNPIQHWGLKRSDCLDYAVIFFIFWW